MLADYRLLKGPQDKMPPMKPSILYEYILAQNGVFLHAKRTGLEVTLQVAAPWSPNLKIRGLQKAEAIIQCDYPPVPFELSRPMLTWAESAKDASGGQLEILFHLVWHEDKKKWELHIPLQEQSATSCKPVGAALAPGGSYERATIEVHSHHSMKAFFSSTDDKDEQGFRIYGVLGTIFDQPTLRLRIGVYGQFWEVPAEDFFELGEGGQEPVIQDAYFDGDRNATVVEEEVEGIPV